MKRMAVVIVFTMLLFVMASYTAAEERPSGFVEGLDFPVGDISYLSQFQCFGLYPWDTMGNESASNPSIDLAAKYDPTSTSIVRVSIIAPADAEVVWIRERVSGAGANLLNVLLKMNRYWYITFNFEPQVTDPTIFAEQQQSIVVQAKKHVKRGDLIGELIVYGAGVVPGHYPHVAFSFIYKNPDDTLDYIFENAFYIRRSDGTDLAPIIGPGSPWKPEDLNRVSTFYCPYEYSTPQARATYNSLPSTAVNGDTCNCVCAYGSMNGNCGVCGSH